MIALQLDGLTKRFRGRLAVDDLSLSVDAGQVYGFLGPNGAGKTTTIRMILNLVHPSTGSAIAFGQNIQREPAILRRVGATVESASFYPYLSARDNLRLLSHVRAVKVNRINRLLEQVGLAARADDHVRGYSTGMRQRLGIAAALLGDPDLLILDEPGNGLDPQGMVEIRNLLRALAEQMGKAVFLSSHLLSEVEQLCDRVAIIHQGRLVREGAISELLAARGSSVQIRVDDSAAALAALLGWWRARQSDETECIEVFAPHDMIPQVINRLVEKRISIYEVSPRHPSLETLFLELTSQVASDPDSAETDSPSPLTEQGAGGEVNA